MNRDDVTRWAREAGFHAWYTQPEEHPEHVAIIERFAALAYAAGAAAECDKFNKERQQYADWFDEAAADIADWGGYASEYFQEKYDLQANVRDFKNRAVAIRARGQA